MKNKYLLSLFAILIMQLFWGQTTETFETETTSSTTFTDNSQVFTITSQAQGPFDINTDYPGTGWNGSTADNIFLDNDLEADLGVGVEFTISSGGSSFTLKSIYLYLADNSANVNVSGGLTIVGKLGGTSQFTVSQSSSFNNTNLGINNGFTLIDFTSFGGTNNSNTNIDEFLITTTGSFNYVALDAMKWDVAASTAPTVTSVTVPANAAYIAGQNLDFTINTSENVTVNTTGGTPQISITIGATMRQATYQSGSGTSALLFRYTVQTGELDTDGIAVGTLIANGGTLRNASSNDANLTLNSIGSTSAVLIDAVAPSIPSTPNMGGVSDSGSSSTDDITTDTTPNFLGSKGVGSDIIKLTSSVDGLLGTASSNGSTNWLFNSSPVLSEGVHNITATATNGAGNESAASASLTITIDTTAPTVGSSNPTDNATGVDGSGNIIITFNENIVFGTGNIEVIDETDGSNSFTINTASPGSQAAISGALLTISPSSNLDEFSNYSVRIDATAIDDVAGNSFAGINNGTTLNFTTTGNTAPVVDTNNGLTVTEGATAIIDSGKLHASDTETSDDSQKTFTVTTATTKGTLFLDANQNNIYDTGDTVLGLSTTFTMDNINNNRIRYTSTSDIDIADSFVFTLSDPDGGSLTNQPFSITITPVNDGPSIAINNGITLNQGNNIVITNANLNEGDPDDSGLGVTYTITTDVINGQLFLDANSNGTFDGGENQIDINESFTQADIDNGLVVYQHNGSQTTSDNFEFSLADGGDNGTTALMGQTFNITINDVTPPTVTSVTVPANATYTTGQNLDFTINFNENITVYTGGGTPQLSITIGANTRQATYQSGSGTSALLFRYTVQAGEQDPDGIAIGTLSANGGTLRDDVTNDATLTLNSIGSTTTVLVDATKSTVVASSISFSSITQTGMSVSWTNGNGARRIVVAKSGSAVSADPVDGTTGYFANAAFGSGTDLGYNNYIVYDGTGSSVTLTGLTDATTYHYKVIEFNGTGATANYLLTGAPTANQASQNEPVTITSMVRQNPVTATTDADQVVFRVTFASAVTNVDVTDFALSGTAAGDGTLSTVTPISASVYDVTVTGVTNSNGTLNLDIKGNGGVSGSNNIEELAGAVLSQTTTGNTIAQPEIGQSFTASATGDFIDVTFYMNLAATYNGAGTLELRAGEGLSGSVLATESVTFVDQPTAYQQKFTFSTPAAVTLGSVYTIRISGTFGTSLTFDAKTGNPFVGGIIYIPTALASADLTFEATISTGVGALLSTVAPTIDETYTISNNVVPNVSSVTVPANTTYTAGQNLDFTINFDENVTVDTGGGTPQMSLTIGATTRQATYQSGSGTSALLFRYTVQNDDLDTDGIAVGALASNGGTIQDTDNADATLTLNSVGSTTAVLVDADAPTITSVTVPANAIYIAGENLDFTINMSENVTVNTAGGTPQMAMTIGATTRQAIYQSGSGTSTLFFRYTVQTGELDTDGIAIGTLSTNGGTLMDGAINNINNTLNSVGSTTEILVDAVAPVGYTVSFDQNPINDTNEASINFSYTAAEIGSTYNYTISSSGGGTNLTGTGTIITMNDQVTGIDLSTLADGAITLEFTLTDIHNNIGNIVSDAVIKGTDTDNDGIADSLDNCPSIANSNQLDTDTDGEGDVCDIDDDNDGTLDSEDAFPVDNSEDTDTDGDGTGNNTDTDDDNDGILDSEDAFPLDNSEDTDTDGDGTGNNADTDDDNDGTLDSQDVFPLDPTEDKDSDDDGIGDNADTDDDLDITVNTPVPAEAFTPNGDGINDAWLVPGISNYPNNVVKVFNRFGHEVYAKRNYQNDWNGRRKSGSSILPAGSYLYAIDLGNGTAPLQGWIFINY